MDPVAPFEILEGEKKKNENLYTNQEEIVLTKTNYTFVSKICLYQYSHRKFSSSFGEGPISLVECSKIINSFPVNKAPGNDGLPIEFYKTFWNFFGEPLVECLNTSFIKGEMSPSERQAVITLIEKKKRSRSV